MAIITDADLKAHLKITTSVDDTIISNAVKAANRAVVQYCGRDFSEKVAVASETARVFEPRSCTVVAVDDIWDTTNLVVETDPTGDGTYSVTWAISDYQLEPLNGRANGVAVSWHLIRAVATRRFPDNRRASVRVTAAWGWVAVPEDVFEGALLKAARLFHRKDSPQGVAGFDEFGAIRITAHDNDVKGLLDPYRRPENVLQAA